MNALPATGGVRCPFIAFERPYREDLLLPGGGTVRLRPARWRDADALQALIASMSPASRTLRFHGGLRALPPRLLHEFATQRPGGQALRVAGQPLLDAAGHRLVAAAADVVDDEAPAEAEFALAVADDWQRRGLGRALLVRLAIHAATQGIDRLWGAVRPGNAPMLALAEAIGGSVETRTDGLRVNLPL